MNKVTVIGGGVMGHGIAQNYAQHGTKVTIYDINDESLDNSKVMIQDSLNAMLEKEIITEDELNSTLDNLSYSLDLEESVKNSDMVVEVIPERIELKHDLFRKIEAIVDEKTIIASNTSAIPLSDLIKGAKHPERFIITHFFAPAQMVPLVEIVQLDDITDREVVEKVKTFLDNSGKSAIVLKKEVPGFIANRMQLALLREAFWIYENGVATAEEIDIAIKDSLGFRYGFLGPLEGQDIAGLGTTYNVSKSLFPVLDSRTDVHPFLQEMMDNNEVGLRTNKGFYEYTEESARAKLQRRNDNFLEVMKLRKQQEEKFEK